MTHNTVNIQLAERIGALCPFFSDPQVFFCSSGAEAVDGALKVARYVTGRPGVIAFQGAFHGRTLAATALTTAKRKYQSGYSPFLPGVSIAPYGGDISYLKRFVDGTQIGHPYKSGAVIVEPVLGEGGYILPPLGWLQGLRDFCDEHGMLLIFDEVQTGCGRTGSPFAAETFSVRPDVLLFAKGVASGMPLGGIVSERAYLDNWPVGAHGSTFGGNPVSCAAALATLDVLDRCYENVREFGAYTLERLSALPYPVRGVGLMVGIETPSYVHARSIQLQCLRRGLIVITCGKDDNVIRLMPPLTITFEELTNGLWNLEEAVRAVN